MSNLPFESLSVWRVVPPPGVFREAMKTVARFPGKWHRAGASVIYAYESPELAVQSLSLRVGASFPRDLHRERIDLPVAPGVHEKLSPKQADDIMAGRDAGSLASDLARYMQFHARVALWIPCPWFDRQHVILVNPLHPLHPTYKVTSRLVEWSEPLLTVAWLPTR